MESPSVATNPLARVRAKSQRSVFQKRKRVVVATNVYSRKTLERQKRRSVNFENKDSRVVYAWGVVYGANDRLRLNFTKEKRLPMIEGGDEYA